MDRARTGVLAIGVAVLALTSCSRSLLAFEPQTRSTSKPPEQTAAKPPERTARKPPDQTATKPPERTATGVPPSSAVLRSRHIEQAIKRCTVPNLIGLNVKAADPVLQKTGLALGDVSRRTDSRPAGAIIGQSEKPDSQVPCGSRVDIVTASSDEPRLDCAAPKLTGDDEQLAKRHVIGAKLVVGRIGRRADLRYPVGTVIDQSPQPGRPVRCGSSVDFLIAIRNDPPLCGVPGLLNADLGGAKRALEDQKLKLGSVASRLDTRPKGTIIAQSPERGALIPCGSSVSVLVAEPPSVPSYCTVPSLYGSDSKLAGRELGGNKLSLGRVVSRRDPRPQGTVIDQSPRQGAQVACGSAVEIVVAAPPEVTTRYCSVPGLLGADPPSAEKQLGGNRLALGQIIQRTDDRPRGTVIDQAPPSGAQVVCGSSVDIVVAVPPESCTVPKLVGVEQRSVSAALDQARLTLGKTGTRQDQRPAGTVIQQVPEAGTPVRCGSPVDVVLAATPACPPIPTPTLVGRDEQLAVTMIVRAGLRVGYISRRESDQPTGTILSQSYPPNTPIKCEASIDLVVAERVIRVPPLSGQDAMTARRTLAAAGLRLGRSNERESTMVQGSVIDQTPAPGAVVKPDSLVDVWLAVPPPIKVPDLRGRDLSGAKETLARVGLRLAAVGERESNDKAGSVVDQNPASGLTVKPDSAVNVWIAVPIPVEVPNLVGRATQEADSILSRARLNTGVVRTRQSVEAPGSVLQQSPAPGTRVNPGTAVDLLVASAPPKVLVPQLAGRLRTAALDLIRDADLSPGNVSERESDQPPGTVVEQRPAAATSVPPGTAVDFVLAVPVQVTKIEPPEQVTVPDLRGRTRNDAAAIIQNARLLVGSMSDRPSAEPGGTVVAQDPPAGAVAGVGALVSIWLAVPIVPVQPQQTMIPVPRVIDASLEQAFVLIRGAGLQPGTVTPSSATAGTVTSQFPAPGAQVAPGTAIDIFVAVPAAPAWSFAPLQWLGAGLLLGLGVAAAASFTRKLVNRFANPPVLAPRSDAGFQTSDPDDERLADFVVTLDAYPDRGEQALEETDGFVTGNWTGKQVMT